MKPATDDDVIAAFSGGYGLLLNVRTGKFHTVNATMSEFWRLLQGGHDLPAAQQALAESYKVSLQIIERDTEPAIAQLKRYGMLRTRPASRRLAESFAAREPMPPHRIAVTDTRAHDPGRYTAAAAWAGFLLALVLQRVPFRYRLVAMRAIRRLRVQRPTLADTTCLLALVRRIARHHPGWADCYELSIGAFIALTLLGKAPNWLLLATFPTPQLHACLEVGDTVVDHAPQHATENQPLIRI